MLVLGSDAAIGLAFLICMLMDVLSIGECRDVYYLGCANKRGLIQCQMQVSVKSKNKCRMLPHRSRSHRRYAP